MQTQSQGTKSWELCSPVPVLTGFRPVKSEMLPESSKPSAPGLLLRCHHLRRSLQSPSTWQCSWRHLLEQKLGCSSVRGSSKRLPQNITVQRLPHVKTGFRPIRSDACPWPLTCLSMPCFQPGRSKLSAWSEFSCWISVTGPRSQQKCLFRNVLRGECHIFFGSGSRKC